MKRTNVRTEAEAAPDAKAAGSDARREVVSSRVFEAPPDALFRAFSDAEALAQWWGPKGFRNTFQIFEFRPGGRWLLTMHAPDGTAFQMEKRFIEVDPPRAIVLEHQDPVHRFWLAITFEALGGERTQLHWRMTFEAEEELARHRARIVEANEENFDRLAAQLTARIQA